MGHKSKQAKLCSYSCQTALKNPKALRMECSTPSTWIYSLYVALCGHTLHWKQLITIGTHPFLHSIFHICIRHWCQHSGRQWNNLLILGKECNSQIYWGPLPLFRRLRPWRCCFESFVDQCWREWRTVVRTREHSTSSCTMFPLSSTDNSLVVSPCRQLTSSTFIIFKEWRQKTN